jgi:hypothetical protein
MRNGTLFRLGVSFAGFVLLGAAIASAQSTQKPQSPNNTISPMAQGLAAQMVPAQAVLDKELDSRKAQPGQEFRVTLTSSVQLKNGPELPRGTELVGTVVTDNMNAGAKSTLALRFTQADVHSGSLISIQATIIGISPPSTSDTWDQSDSQAPPQPWNGSALTVDDVGVASGVDLHSRIAGANSGVFVSRKDEMKIAARSQISLAIAAQAAGAMNGGE